jgi:hypothetical protein
MGVADFRRFIDFIMDAGIGEVDVLGGEPTLHPGFVDMIDALLKCGLKASFSTNGSNLPVLYEAAARSDGGRIMPGVSINSDFVDEDLHEFIGAFKPRVKSIHSGGPLPDAARRYLGVPGVEYYLLYMDAVSEKALESTMPFYGFLEELYALKSAYGNVEGVHCGFLMPPGLEDVRCPAGRFQKHMGEPCPRLLQDVPWKQL